MIITSIAIYLFRDAVMVVQWTNNKFAKPLNTIRFPEDMKEDVKYLIRKYMKHSKMMFNDSGENISINAWSGFS